MSCDQRKGARAPAGREGMAELPWYHLKPTQTGRDLWDL